MKNTSTNMDPMSKGAYYTTMASSNISVLDEF
jgi:hypothetical protein